MTDAEFQESPSLAGGPWQSYASLETERDRLNQLLGELLATIHRDGGQHQQTVGAEQATRNAIRRVEEWRAERDAMTLDRDHYRQLVAVHDREHDAYVMRLVKACQPFACMLAHLLACDGSLGDDIPLFAMPGTTDGSGQLATVGDLRRLASLLPAAGEPEQAAGESG